MKRRVFLAVCATLASPASAWAQGARRFRVGFLATSDAETTKPFVTAFLAGLKERGYQEGRDLVLDLRHANGSIDRLPALAAEMIALKPDVIAGLEPAVVALRAKTTTIPLVLLAATDPVAAGLAKSLARPGTNVTGLTNQFAQLVEKHIELLLEMTPSITRVALLNYGPSTPESAERFRQSAETAASGRRLALVSSVARDAESLRQAFAGFEAARAGALIVVPTAPALQMRRVIIEHAVGLRLPLISGLPPMWSDAGALLNYGANALADYRYAASFVDRILRGANPAETPIEQISRFELAVNLKTARQMGIEVPRSILLRADRIIE